jgi:hypothetical protein
LLELRDYRPMVHLSLPEANAIQLHQVQIRKYGFEANGSSKYAEEDA